MEQNPEARDLDTNESLNLEGRIGNWSTNNSTKVESLKSMVKFLVPICVFSLFLSIFSLFPHSFSVYFSTFLFSLLNHAIERKYMFFICNSILFVLATCSLIKDSSSSSSFFETFSFNSNSYNIDDDYNQFEPDLVAAIEEQNQGIEEINGGELLELEDEIEESEEELNKKIEEFIRKMKEEMRSEAASNSASL